VEHFQSVIHSAAAGNLVTENDLLAVVMRARIEEERAGRSTCHFVAASVHCAGICICSTAWLEDGPAGETSRDFLHVFLRVTTVDAECVQLHQLARVVFVDATAWSLLLGLLLSGLLLLLLLLLQSP